MNAKKYICLAGIMIPMAMQAQNQTICDFETADSYKKVSVYDTWADSPFRTGRLKGNAKVVNNHLNDTDITLGYAPNTSSKILGVQRSRFGSNTFGALVELKEPLALKKQTQYVHIKMYAPKSSKVMLIGLGNRTDRTHQPKTTEQFWSVPRNQVEANKWCDIVFPISGANGINIYSLLVVVDRESPHALSADYAAYIDDIILSTSSDPFFSSTPYPINYETSTKITHAERYTTGITFKGSEGTQNIAVNQKTDKLLYHDKMDKTILAKPGETLTPSVDFKGSWMAGYVYIDKGNDGAFNVTYNDNSITDMGDLMSYSLFKGKTSTDATVAGTQSPSANAPAFTIPEEQKPGFYRIRYKLDWDNVDPGGNTTAANPITGNGGIIVDARINIHADNVNLSRATEENGGGLNGDILLANGDAVTGKTTPFNKAFAVKAVPAPGFEFDYVKIRHGYNLEGANELYGNKQWEEVRVNASQFTNGEYTIPASMVDGDLRFVPFFKSVTAISGTEAKDNGVSFRTEPGKLIVSTESAQSLNIVDTAGNAVFSGTVEGTHTIMLHAGVYVANGKKLLVP